MEISRKKNAMLGTIWGIVQKFLSILFPFIIRSVFIYTLGIEYLGLNSLFTSLLQVLNLVELGVSSALVFSMYKPIVENDTYKICALMNLYKIYYRYIGCVILIIGLIFVPFIPFLIKGTIPTDINIYVVYLMNLISTVLSYWLFSYKSSLFHAHQRTDILSIISSAVLFFSYIIQIICLLETKNYYLYIATNILSIILINLISAYISSLYYPNYIAKGELTKKEKKIIFLKIRDLFTAKIGGIVNHSSDSLVISSFLGLSLLAIYQNYYFIVYTIIGFFLIFYNACEAGIANSLIVKSKEDNLKLFYNINHCSLFALNFSVSSLICLYQPFIELWVGKECLLDFLSVILLALYLIAEIIPRTLIVFKDAGGIWSSDKFRPLTVSIVNLLLNLLLVNTIGLKGVIISTIFAMLFVGLPWLICNINKELFSINIKIFSIYIVKYLIVIFLSSVTSYILVNILDIKNLYLTIIYRILICLLIPNTIFIIVFKNKHEQKYLKNEFFNLINKIYLKIFNKI